MASDEEFSLLTNFLTWRRIKHTENSCTYCIKAMKRTIRFSHTSREETDGERFPVSMKVQPALEPYMKMYRLFRR